MKNLKWLPVFIFAIAFSGGAYVATPYFWPTALERKINPLVTSGQFGSVAAEVSAYKDSPDAFNAAFAQLYLAYAEFLIARDIVGQDPRGVFFQLQAVKAKISAALESLKAPGASSRWNVRIERKAAAVLAEIVAFELEHLASVRKQLQQEQLRYQQEAQAKTYEAWGREFTKSRQAEKAKKPEKLKKSNQ